MGSTEIMGKTAPAHTQNKPMLSTHSAKCLKQEEDPLDRHKGSGRNRKKHDKALHSFAKAAKSNGDESLYV